MCKCIVQALHAKQDPVTRLPSELSYSLSILAELRDSKQDQHGIVRNTDIEEF